MDVMFEVRPCDHTGSVRPYQTHGESGVESRRRSRSLHITEVGEVSSTAQDQN